MALSFEAHVLAVEHPRNYVKAEVLIKRGGILDGMSDASVFIGSGRTRACWMISFHATQILAMSLFGGIYAPLDGDVFEALGNGMSKRPFICQVDDFSMLGPLLICREESLNM